jgi:diguanylate cyclase (GGDEF)-like protein
MADANAAMDALASELARLRVAYAEKLPAELDALNALAGELTGTAEDRARMEALRNRLHKLAGSGGSFGFAMLSEQARCLEHRVVDWLADAMGSQDTVRRSEFARDLAALRDTLAEASAAPALPAPIGETRHEAGRSIHVWLVEEDAQLGKELARLLEPFGFEVKLFTQIGKAETAAQAECPDVLIMDATFSCPGDPRVPEAPFRSLKELGCPLIFISSDGDFASRIHAARLGADGYMLKPLDVPRLVERVEHIFELRNAPPQRVLIVDDDADLAAHFRLVLMGAGMHAEVLDQPDQIVEQLSAFRPELVLMDMNMPEYSGIELAGVIRQHDNWVGLPIVYLSAETDLDKQLQALGRGGDDFLTKPISDSQLIAAVRARIGRARQLTDQINKDSLTGLLKHASIKEAAQLEVMRARRSGKPVAIAMLDIDHFKSVNDAHGHATGDLVIKSIATLLRQRLRQSDLIGRYGGEEFVAVLPECSLESARMVFDDIRKRFAALQFNQAAQRFNCTLSAGIACSAIHPDLDAAALLILADQALYAAKRGGRNQVCVETSESKPLQAALAAPTDPSESISR